MLSEFKNELYIEEVRWSLRIYNQLVFKLTKLVDIEYYVFRVVS